MKRWVESGALPDQVDDDLLNAAALPEWLELPAGKAAAMAVEAAVAADHAVSSLADEMWDSISMLGFTNLLSRSVHRKEHLDEIDAVLGV